MEKKDQKEFIKSADEYIRRSWAPYEKMNLTQEVREGIMNQITQQFIDNYTDHCLATAFHLMMTSDKDVQKKEEQEQEK